MTTVNIRFIFSALAVTSFALVGMVNVSSAQHSDIEFGYDDIGNPGGFIIENDEVTNDGIQFFESEFEMLDPMGDPGNYSSDEPGYENAPDEGLLVGTGHQIWINVLDASQHSQYGQGYINFYNPMTDALEANGRISIMDNTASTADLLLFGTGVESGPNPQFLAIGGADQTVGDVHVDFDLLDDATAPVGAYGLLLQLQSDFDGDGVFEISSDPYWVIFNRGLDEAVFDEFALAAFGAEEVPEPSSAILLSAGALVLLRRRR